MTVAEERNWLCAILAVGTGILIINRWPFPAENALLQLVWAERPFLFTAIKDSYLAMCFTTPYICFSMAASLLFIFRSRREVSTELAKLPVYPDADWRENLYLVLGEVHHRNRPEPVPNPTWLTIPERGLYTGIAVFGAIGSGKTSGCMYPYAEQILAFGSTDKSRRIG